MSEIPDEGLQLGSVADFSGIFPDGGWSLDEIDLAIARRGQEVAVTGRFQATARLQCSRCLEPLVSTIASDVDVQLLPFLGRRHEEVELSPDDLEVDFYEADTLDVGRLLRSETQLALPMKPLCHPDCRGLCSICGGNRNLTPCACEASRVDPRLAPLEALRRRE